MMSRRSNGKSSGKPLVPQPHGGALLPGAGGGPQLGAGRPRSEILRSLAGVLEGGIPLLKDICDGEAVRKTRVPLLEVLRHARCPECDGKLHAPRKGQTGDVEIESRVSVSPGDRIRALELAARYGLGIEKTCYDAELIGKLGHATTEVFGGDERLKDLHKRWVAVIGEHMRGGR